MMFNSMEYCHVTYCNRVLLFLWKTGVRDLKSKDLPSSRLYFVLAKQLSLSLEKHHPRLRNTILGETSSSEKHHPPSNTILGETPSLEKHHPRRNSHPRRNTILGETPSSEKQPSSEKHHPWRNNIVGETPSLEKQHCWRNTILRETAIRGETTLLEKHHPWRNNIVGETPSLEKQHCWRNTILGETAILGDPGTDRGSKETLGHTRQQGREERSSVSFPPLSPLLSFLLLPQFPILCRNPKLETK